MHIDVMTGPGRWDGVQKLAAEVEQAGFSGMVFTEMSQPPWLSIAAAHHAAPTLALATGQPTGAAPN